MAIKRRSPTNPSRLDQVVANARKDRESREQGYREKSLKMYPWVCGRCTREFDLTNLHELTVHHRNHNHDDNPEDGSNWELLCLYCHDDEHSRYENANLYGQNQEKTSMTTHKALAGLQDLLKKHNET